MINTALKHGLGRLSDSGALIVDTGEFTGRAAKQKYIVRRPETESIVDWGKVNQPIEANISNALWRSMEHKLLRGEGDSFSYRGYVGPFAIRVDSLSPWHIAFARNMFRRFPAPLDHAIAHSEFRILHDPWGRLSDYGISFSSETVIILDPARARVMIVGTAYAGEMKKAAFSMANYLLPSLGFLSMHASANCLEDGSATSVLFGLSGTGKTTLSAAPDRFLIGDDEILWSPSGVSNLEGGCYAKLIDLDPEREPLIYRAVNRSGAILENVVADATGRVDFSDRSKTENTRGSYPIEAIERTFTQDREAKAPETIVFLTADAFGALPAVARLDEWQAQYHFMAGYTAKVAGTELGVKAPEAAFSACFGAPFMPLHVSVYARLLSDYCRRSGTSVWLLNTGWTRGGYGKGPRFPISTSRRLLSAIQSGELSRQVMVKHPVFGFDVPANCPEVDPDLLKIPLGRSVLDLARRFSENFSTFARSNTRNEKEIIEKGGPRLS